MRMSICILTGSCRKLSAEVAETGESGRPGVRHATAGVFVLADMVGAALSGRIALDPPVGTLALLAFVFAVAGTAAGLLLPLSIVPVVAVVASRLRSASASLVCNRAI